MGRAEFQVLVIPYKITFSKHLLFSILKREGEGYWQWIAGGGEENESIIQAAKREAFEEAGIDPECNFMKLDSLAMVPVTHFKAFKNRTDIFVIPEYCFGVNVHDEILLSAEHTEYRWVNFETAMQLLKWDSNKTALWELDARISRSMLS
ncbi:NUDIX hydrolase [Paenibacillus sp. BAC0078]